MRRRSGCTGDERRDRLGRLVSLPVTVRTTSGRRRASAAGLALVASFVLAGCQPPTAVEEAGAAALPKIRNSKDYEPGPAERPDPTYVATYAGEPIVIKSVHAYGDRSSSIELVFSTVDLPPAGTRHRRPRKSDEKYFEVSVAPVLMPGGTREWRINRKHFPNHTDEIRSKGVSISKADVYSEVWGNLDFDMVSAGTDPSPRRITFHGNFIATGSGVYLDERDKAVVQREIPVDVVVAGTKFDIRGAVLRPASGRKDEEVYELVLSSTGESCEPFLPRADLELRITLDGPDARPTSLRLAGEVAPDASAYHAKGLGGIVVDVRGPLRGPGHVEVRLSDRREFHFSEEPPGATDSAKVTFELDGTFQALRCAE
jgi:hypothetical protein